MFGRKAALLRKALALYAGEHVLNQVLAEGERFLRIDFAPTEMSLAYFDFDPFPAPMARITPAALGHYFQAYYDAATSIVARHGGTFNGFIGDSGLAWWPAADHRDHADRALACAREIVEAVDRLRAPEGADAWPEGSLHANIHSGQPSLGNHGSSRRFRFTVMGDDVNVVARLWGPGWKRSIVVSEAAYRHLGGKADLEEIGEVKVTADAPLKVYSPRFSRR